MSNIHFVSNYEAKPVNVFCGYYPKENCFYLAVAVVTESGPLEIIYHSEVETVPGNVLYELEKRNIAFPVDLMTFLLLNWRYRGASVDIKYPDDWNQEELRNGAFNRIIRNSSS